MPKTLYKHQQALVDRNPKRHLIAFDVRLGKTLTVLELANKNGVGALIVCPKHLHKQWKEAAAEYPQDHLVVTKEELRRDWDKLPRKSAFIGDESHVLCGPGNAGKGSQIAQAVGKYLNKHDIQYRWFLSATPINSRLESAFMLLKHLGQSVNYWWFQKQFFYQIKMGSRMIPRPKPTAYDDVAELLKPHGTFVKMEEVIDVPEELFTTEHYELHPDQKKAIKAVDTDNPLTRFSETIQIENFALKGDGYDEDKIFPSYKLDRIVDLATQNDKVVIFAKYRLQIAEIERKVREAVEEDKEVFVLQGGMDPDDFADIVKQAERAKKAVVVISVGCSAGYELASFSLMVFASLPWSYVDYYQCCGRIKTIDPNKIKKNMYITLLTQGGVECEVQKALDRKEDFRMALFEKEEVYA